METPLTVDYPSRTTETSQRKVLAMVDGKPSIVQSALEHRTGNFLTSLNVYDSVGSYVYSETMDLPIECQMANEVKTIQKKENGLPTLIRKNQLGENLTQGITRILVEQSTGAKNKELKVLNQQQISLEWDSNNRLKSATTFQLTEYSGDKEIWTPETVKTFPMTNKVGW